MEFEAEDLTCFKNHYFFDDESARQLSHLIGRARSTTNNEKARHLLMRADTLVYRGYLSQLEKVDEFYLDSCADCCRGLDLK